MRQITFNYFRRLALMLLAVVGFTTTALAQEDEWTIIFENSLGGEWKTIPSDPIYTGGFIRNNADNLSLLDPSSSYFPYATFTTDPDVYLAVKKNLEPGTYKFSFRVKGYNNKYINVFYTTDISDTSSRNILLENLNTSSLTKNFGPKETGEFEISVAGDYYIGICGATDDEWKYLYLADFIIYKKGGAEPDPTTYSVTVEPTNCTVSVKDASNDTEISELSAVPENTELKVTVNPSEGFEFGSLTYSIYGGVTDETLDNGGTFTLTGNATIKAVCNETVEPVEPYAQNYGQGTGDGTRSWTNTVFSTITDGTKTVGVNYTPNGNGYDIYNDALVSEGNKATVLRGEQFDLTINGKMNWIYTLVYIDWNGDGVFDEADGTENLGFNPVVERNFGAGTTTNEYVRTYKVTVPDDAKIGDTRVRIIFGWKQTNLSIIPSGEADKELREMTSTTIDDKKNAIARDFSLCIMDNQLAERTITLAVNDPSMGKAVITGTEDTSITTSDTNVSLTAVPEEGYMFVNWTDEQGQVLSTDNPYLYGGLENATITANFDVKTYPVMTRKYNTTNQQNRYLKEVIATVGGKAQTLFTATTTKELPLTEYTTNGEVTESGALIDKTDSPIVLEQGTTSFDMTFKAWTENILNSYNTQLVWTSQAIYVDWNNDKDFDDANECLGAVGTPATTNNFGDANGSLENGWTRTLNVPADVAAGTYRMRVVYHESNATGWENTFFSAGKGNINAGVSYDFSIRIDEQAETTPEYTVTLNKPENGNLSVTYNNGEKDVTVSTDTEAQTFNVAENTKLTVTVTPAEGYQLETLSPDMTKVEDNENVYEYTVTEPVTIQATFTLIPDTDPIIGVGTDSATAPVTSTADSPVWFVMKSSHLTVTERQNRFMYWNEENSRLECTQHNEGIKLSEISDAYRWRFEDAEDGNIYIINKATGKALVVPEEATSADGSDNVNTPLVLGTTGSKWSFALSSTVNNQALPNQYCFDYVDYNNSTEAAYLNAMDGGAIIPYGITVYAMGVQNASGWFIYEAPAEENPKNNVKVETADAETGTVSIEGNNETSVSVEVGSVLTLKATPKAGYMFDKWTKKGTEEVVSYRHTFDLTVTEDTELVANFVEEGYPLMTRYFITDLNQQNRYFGEVGYNVDEEAIRQLFKCETEKDLPFTAYPELHKQQREGAVIDKTENKIEIVEGTTEFNMLFKQYTKNITYNNIVCEPELEWTQQAIYIDWNNDMKFEGTEIYDRISGSQLADANGMTRKIEVPAETKPGTYRMRVVQMQFDDNNNISHTNLFTENFGEIRLGMAYDFEIVVTPAPDTYPVTVATGITGGKITLKVDGKELTGEVEEGKTVTVEVTPDKYYELATLTYKVGEDGEEQDIKDIKSFNVTGETVVNATFNKLSYTITFQQPQNGTIKVMNDKTEIQSGAKIEGGTRLTIVDTPESNYVLSELIAGETDILEEKSFIVENDTEIKAVFALTEHTFTYTLNVEALDADITIKDGEGNDINNGDKVKFGSEYTIRVEKKDNNNVVNIEVNGEKVTAEVNGLVYTYTGTVNGDTHVTIDLYSDIETLDAENVYYDANAHVLYTGGAKAVKVYDLSGRLVLNAENQETISLTELADGIYTAVIDNLVLKLKK